MRCGRILASHEHDAGFLAQRADRGIADVVLARQVYIGDRGCSGENCSLDLLGDTLSSQACPPQACSPLEMKQ